MTLDTSIVFRTPVDAEKAFGIARHHAKVPADNPILPRDKWQDNYPTAAYFGHTICGAQAMVEMYVALDGQPESKYCRDECPEQGGCDPECRDWYVHISLNTTYGARPCCVCIHFGIIRALYEAFPEADIAWDDEFTGRWYSKAPPETCDTHSGTGENHESYLPSRCNLIFQPEYAV